MCGLFGVMGPGITLVDLEILEQLATVSILRGMHATGLVQGKVPWGKSKGNIEDLILEKDCCDATYFLYYHSVHKDGNRKLFRGVSNNFFIGHVRHATKGGLTAENAHPFVSKHIVGMHNGTLHDKRYQHAKITDSELLIKDISKRGAQKVLEELDDYDNAYALVLLDKEEKKIHFIRNEGRTLFFCRNKDRSVIYWASEKWMLRGILERKNEKMFENAIYRFEPGFIYSIDPSESLLRLNSNQSPFKKVKINKRAFSTKKEETREKKVIRVNDNHIKIVYSNDKDVKENKNNKNSSKIPYTYCCDCHKKLNLIEQFRSYKVGQGAFLCETCENRHLSGSFQQEFPM